LRLTQAQAAQRSGIQQRQVSVIERGGDVMLSTMTKLARALDLDILVIPREDSPKIHAILNAAPTQAPAAAESLLDRYRVSDDEGPPGA
jgi:transcriptional regulator with XRE-family HTH domain